LQGVSFSLTNGFLLKQEKTATGFWKTSDIISRRLLKAENVIQNPQKATTGQIKIVEILIFFKIYFLFGN